MNVNNLDVRTLHCIQELRGGLIEPCFCKLTMWLLLKRSVNEQVCDEIVHHFKSQHPAAKEDDLHSKMHSWWTAEKARDSRAASASRPQVPKFSASWLVHFAHILHFMLDHIDHHDPLLTSRGEQGRRTDIIKKFP